MFDSGFLEDLAYWTRTKRSMALRILRLVEATIRDPFTGLGKPERLRGNLAGRWSRRTDREHRLIYQVGDERICFLSARYHY